jgi:hypothetical protein
MKPDTRDLLSRVIFASLLIACASFAHSQTISPFQGLGTAQFFDNNGNLLTSGVLYSYQAGTSTQQATFTDSTGTVVNANPLPFGSGARISIWLTAGAYYKFVLCSQNDGAFCAPSDVMFSVDQVPGSPGGSSSGSSTFTGTFISGTANPATSGLLRLATGDQICWRNTAGTANLCIFKDGSDVLGWQGGSIKFPEIACSNTGANYDYLCADNSAHRWKMANNGGGQIQIVGAGADINTLDQVTQLHFGSTPTPLGAAPGANTYLFWNGSQVIGGNSNFCPSTTGISTNTTLTTSNCIITVNAGAANLTITIPVAAVGTMWHIARSDSSSHTLTLVADAGNINGRASITLPGLTTVDCFDSGNVWCNGMPASTTEWATVGSGCVANGGICTTSGTWPQPFVDATYQVVCTPTSESSNSVAQFWISSQTAAGFTISIDNRGTNNPGGFGGFYCTGHHN